MAHNKGVYNTQCSRRIGYLITVTVDAELVRHCHAGTAKLVVMDEGLHVAEIITVLEIVAVREVIVCKCGILNGWGEVLGYVLPENVVVHFGRI